MSMDAVKASGAERRAEREREKQAHEAKLERQILDWIEVIKPKRGNILVLRVPNEKFIHPGTNIEDTTDEQRHTMQACHDVLSKLIQGLGANGVLMGGAAILSEEMRLEDLPPPEVSPVEIPKPGILLPPGTKI